MSQAKKYEQLVEELVQRPRHWLVTGCAGFIGSHLIERLLDLGQKVTGFDNFSTGFQENLDLVQASLPTEKWQNFQMIKGDVRDLEVLEKSIWPVDRVLHQAALGSVPRSIDDPRASFENNVLGTFNVLDCVRRSEKNPHLVWASSSSVYGSSETLPKVENELGEPLSPYAATKRSGELFCHSFSEVYGLPAVSIRYFNVFGPRQSVNGPYAAVIPRWLDACLASKPIQIFGDGETARDFTYIENVIQANLLAAECPEAAFGQTFNVACGRRTTLNELSGWILEAFGNEGSYELTAPVYSDFRPGDVRESLADISRAQKEIGYREQVDVREGLSKTIQYFLKGKQSA